MAPCGRSIICATDAAVRRGFLLRPDADLILEYALAASAVAVTRAVAGAAGLHLEDQVAAKRCGHRPNKEIVAQLHVAGAPAVGLAGDDGGLIMAEKASASGPNSAGSIVPSRG